MTKFINWLRSPEWSPYVGGVGLGLLSIFALLFTDQIFGASGAFENIGGAIMQVINPALADNMYWNFVMPAGFSYGVMMLIGVFLGIAGGCTSGLAISGGVQLAPAAFLFMAGMFASGITTAMILYGKRY
jgi:hypothetical protein